MRNSVVLLWRVAFYIAGKHEQAFKLKFALTFLQLSCTVLPNNPEPHLRLPNALFPFVISIYRIWLDSFVNIVLFK